MGCAASTTTQQQIKPAIKQSKQIEVDASSLIAYLDISTDQQLLGRIQLELFCKRAPISVTNFMKLCTGELGISKKIEKPLHYLNISIHRIVKDFIFQTGDIQFQNGQGGDYIYENEYFNDENLKMKHKYEGTLSMANSGPNMNRSQFFVTQHPEKKLDGKHQVFGRVISGMEVVRTINTYGSKNGKPTAHLFISGCGLIRSQPLTESTESKQQSG
jgi:peptidylprolyl isomerase